MPISGRGSLPGSGPIIDRPRGGRPVFPGVPYPLVDNGPPVTPTPQLPSWVFTDGETITWQDVRFSGTCRGSQILIPVGKCRIVAPIVGWNEAENHDIHFAYCFGVGPAASISNWEISGVAEEDLDTEFPGAVITACSDNYALGTDTQSALTHAIGLWGTPAPKFRNLILTIAAFEKENIGLIGLPSVQADVVMQSWDFRLGTPAYTTNENPVLFLYTYMVKNPWGPRVPSAEIDTTSWGDAADWCDDDMGGGQKRWRCGGVLDGMDVSSVVQAFLQSAWCTLSWLDGKWHLIPFFARRSSLGDYTALTADYIKRRRIGYSRRPSVVKVNYRDVNNDYLDKQVIARSAGAIAGSDRWSTRMDSPPLLNAEDVAKRYANTLLASVSDNNRCTVKVNHKDNPAVLDVQPGDQVRLSTWHVDAGTGTDDLWRVESINHQELVSELELLGDSDALSVTLTSNTTGGSRPTLTRINSGFVNLSGDITLANNRNFYIKDAGGVARSIANVNSSSNVYIGPGVGGGDLMIQADGITLSCPYGAKDLGDIGSETNSTNIDAADGDIHQIGTAEISNLTRVTTPEFRGKLWQGTMEKALTDNSAINLLQWNGTTGKSAAFMIFYECRVEYTQIAGTKYLIESGVITARMTNYSGTVTLGAEKALNNQTNSGTGAMTVTVGTGNGTDYGRVTFNCDLTTGTWVDGEVRYTVINTDTDYSSLTLFG